LQRPQGRGVQLDQLAEGEVWVQNPLHRANKKRTFVYRQRCVF
jgi:hypothetical protein